MNNIKLPPLPKGDIAANTCPLMWVHSDAQLQAYAIAAIEADRKRSKALDKARLSRSVNQIKEALKDRSKPFTASYSEVENLIRFYEATLESPEVQALRKDAEDVVEMALCESRRLVLRIGQTYRFVPRDGCKACEELKAEHDQAYSIDQARSVEGKS